MICRIEVKDSQGEWVDTGRHFPSLTEAVLHVNEYTSGGQLTSIVVQDGDKEDRVNILSLNGRY